MQTSTVDSCEMHTCCSRRYGVWPTHSTGGLTHPHHDSIHGRLLRTFLHERSINEVYFPRQKVDSGRIRAAQSGAFSVYGPATTAGNKWENITEIHERTLNSIKFYHIKFTVIIVFFSLLFWLCLETDSLMEWVTETDQSIDWLVDWLIVDLLISRLIAWLIDWLIVDLLISRLIDWLINDCCASIGLIIFCFTAGP